MDLNTPLHFQRRPEEGNVLFLILIAVALFAALSYAVTQSTRSGGGDASREKMATVLAEIQNVVVAHRTAIERMTMSGISADAIDASDYPSQQYYGWDNTDCLTDACRLYVPNGGGIVFYEFANLHPELAGAPQTPVFPAFPTAMLWFWVGGQGTESADLAFTLNVTKEFCTFINRQLGVNVDIDTTSVFVNTGQTLRAGERLGIGNMPHQWAPFMPGQVAGHLQGQTEGCYVWKYSGGDPNSYRYFALIKAM